MEAAHEVHLKRGAVAIRLVQPHLFAHVVTYTVTFEPLRSLLLVLYQAHVFRFLDHESAKTFVTGGEVIG
jgi:hypothetical protein